MDPQTILDMMDEKEKNFDVGIEKISITEERW